MRKFGFALLALVLVLTLAACTRSASQAPVPTTTSQGALPDGATPSTGGGEPTEDPMILLQQFATQTAQAQAGSGGQATATPDAAATSTPAIILNTPDTAALPSPTPGAVATQAPPTQGPRPTTYTLQQGEFPYCIARRFNVNPDELLSLNGLSDSQVLQPGLVLKIPQSGNTFPGTRALKAHPATYTVGLNDTVYSIACLYGDVDPMAIAANNGLATPYTLKVGQTLNIP